MQFCGRLKVDGKSLDQTPGIRQQFPRELCAWRHDALRPRKSPKDRFGRPRRCRPRPPTVRFSFHCRRPAKPQADLLSSLPADAGGSARRSGLNVTLTPTAPHYSRYPRLSLSPSSLKMVISALRSTSKMAAVDQPNNSTPFIAVIGPSKCQRSTGVTSP
jgi:hypothetical protein